MDRLRALHYCVLCDTQRSFSAVARGLGLSTTAVAKLVGALEQELGVLLFERTPRGLVTTAAGRGYLDACHPALEALNQADDELRGLATRRKGTLVVGVQHVVARGFLTAALPRFHARYPDIALDLRDVQRVSDEAANAVDVMVVLGWPKVTDMVCRQIGAGRFVVAAAPSYWAARGVPAHPRDLADHICLPIRAVDGTVMDVWSFSRDTETVEVTANGWLTVNNDHRDVVVELALLGQGVVRLLDWASRGELESGALVPALLDWESPEAPPVNLIYPARLRRIPRARAFIEFVTDLFGQIAAARSRTLEPSEQPRWQRRRYLKASDAGTR